MLTKLKFTLLVLVALIASPSVAKPALGQPQSPCRHLSVCSYSIRGGVLWFRFGKDIISCRSAMGTAIWHTHSAGSARLSFHGCREEDTVFKFSCSSPANSRRRVTTNQMSALQVEGASNPVFQLQNTRLRFLCGNSLRFEVEGFWSGIIESRHCGGRQREYPLSMTLIAHGGRLGGLLYDVYVERRRDTYEISRFWKIWFHRRGAAMGC